MRYLSLLLTWTKRANALDAQQPSEPRAGESRQKQVLYLSLAPRGLACPAAALGSGRVARISAAYFTWVLSSQCALFADYVRYYGAARLSRAANNTNSRPDTADRVAVPAVRLVGS